MNNISVITLLAYDYEYMLLSLPRYIDLVDEVIIGLDSERKTWAGNSFDIPDIFFQRLKQLDKNNKIRIVEDKFYVPGLKTMELETRERNILSTKTTHQSWILSIDADEILLNAQDTLDFLRHFENDSLCLYGLWIVLYKSVGDTMFLIENNTDRLEFVPMATKNREGFIEGRKTEERVSLFPALSLHYAWARERSQLQRKLGNWGHKEDFDTEQILCKWDDLNEHNFHQYNNFHPVDPPVWSKLKAVNIQFLDAYALEQTTFFYKKFSWDSVRYQAKNVEQDILISQLQAQICKQGDRILELKKELAEARTGKVV